VQVHLSEQLEAALKAQANARGVSADSYAREILERDLTPTPEAPVTPFTTGRGVFRKYGYAPSAEQIDANRAEIFQNFGEDA
jgi:plasmid stability protein